MLKLPLVLTSISLCFFLSGCDTYTGGAYPVSIAANTILKSYAPKNVTVRPFTATTKPSMLCRLVGPIHLPNDQSPSAYFTNAFSDQFQLAGFTDINQPKITISGKITQFGFSSMIGDGTWNFGVTLTSSNGQSMSVSENYHFAASFAGDAACHNVADAFAPAVQALVEKAVKDPSFPLLLKTSSNRGPGNV